MAELIAVRTHIGDLMHNDQLLLGIDRCLHVVVDDSSAARQVSNSH